MTAAAGYEKYTSGSEATHIHYPRITHASRLLAHLRYSPHGCKLCDCFYPSLTQSYIHSAVCGLSRSIAFSFPVLTHLTDLHSTSVKLGNYGHLRRKEDGATGAHAADRDQHQRVHRLSRDQMR